MIFNATVCNYGLETLVDWDHFEKKVETICQKAAAENSKLLILPEYFSFELCSLLSQKILAEQFEQLQQFLIPFRKLFSKLASQYNLYIAAGTFLEKVDHHYNNRCYFFYPNGKFDFQDKCYLIHYEKSLGYINQGTSIKVFDTQLGIIAIQICYDVELPILTQQYLQYPIDLILVPSCTETTAGLNRVQTCARARAIEQQCYVLQSGLTGNVDCNECININVAQAGIYCPSDLTFPADGILSNSEFLTAGIYTTELDLNKIHSIRQYGAVSNYHDLQQIAAKNKFKMEIIHAK